MNSNLSEKTSKRLYELRTNAGYTMEKLASMLNVSKGTISKWEKGSIKNMRQDKVLLLANIFHVSPTYIMGYDVPMEEETVEKNTVNWNKTINGQETKLVPLNSHAAKLVENFDRLSPSQQTLVDNLIETLVSKL
jgi:transcriptional regulator with XRE-family HTH domain